jgi:hypothetical protein
VGKDENQPGGHCSYSHLSKEVQEEECIFLVYGNSIHTDFVRNIKNSNVL